MKNLLISIVLLISTLLFAEGKQPPATPVKVFTVNDKAVKITKKYPATIKAQKSVDIIARVSGSLEKRYFEEGSFVKKGQNLYKIEQRTYQADIDSARASLKRAQSLLVKATSDWNRYKTLFEQKSISASQRDEYYYNYEDAIANVSSAEASLENAKIQYAYTIIKAPMDGIVSITQLNVGNFVSANTTLTTITKVDPIYAEFSIPQTDIGQYLSQIKSENVKFSVNCHNKCLEDGVLKYVSPTLDSSSDTLLLRAQFDNKNAEVIIGQFTNINISNIPMKDVTTIPEEAIMQNGSKAIVYVIDENSLAKIKPIQLTGESSKDGVIVKGNLKVNDKIIISNISKIRPNSKVQIIEARR
nr:efflux RND transporter periplasmic adaptor subunit [uncultured Sulfurimonas sp.]